MKHKMKEVNTVQLKLYTLTIYNTPVWPLHLSAAVELPQDATVSPWQYEDTLMIMANNTDWQVPLSRHLRVPSCPDSRALRGRGFKWQPNSDSQSDGGVEILYPATAKCHYPLLHNSQVAVSIPQGKAHCGMFSCSLNAWLTMIFMSWVEVMTRPEGEGATQRCWFGLWIKNCKVLQPLSEALPCSLLLISVLKVSLVENRLSWVASLNICK